MVIILVLSMFSIDVLAEENVEFSGGELLKQSFLKNEEFSVKTINSSINSTQIEVNAKATYLQNYVDSNKDVVGVKNCDNEKNQFI